MENFETRTEKLRRLQEEQKELKIPKSDITTLQIQQEARMRRVVLPIGVSPMMKQSQLRREQRHLKNLTLKRIKKKKEQLPLLDLFR